MLTLGAIKIDRLTDTFQIEDNVGLSEALGILQCVTFCLRTNVCLVLFFNSITRLCILHSKTFHFKRPTGTGQGWEVFRITDCEYILQEYI